MGSFEVTLRLCDRRHFSRRLAAGCFLALAAPAGRALAKGPGPNGVKLVAWYLAGRLFLAAQSHFGSGGSEADKPFGEAVEAGRQIGVDVPALPPKSAGTPGLIAATQYFLKGDGARLQETIARRNGGDAGNAYATAVKLLQLSQFYDIDPKLAAQLATAMRGKLVSLGIPEPLWKGALDSVDTAGKAAAVRSSAIQAYFDIQAHLVKAARPEMQ